MKKLFYLIPLIILIAIGCKKNDTSSQIEYQVLRKWKPANSGIGMALLVSENATKDEVMKLAKHLRKKYASKPYIWIDIFDSKEAWQNRDNQNYSEEEYFRHWLVQVVKNKNTGYDEIKWQAEGRPIKTKKEMK